MSFGYLGDTSTKIKQQKKNEGILTVNDVRELESLGQLGGSLEKLKTVSASSATNVDFTDIDSVHQYQQLLIYGHSITPSGDGTGYLRVSNDNGSNFRASGYYYAVMIFDGAGNADTSLDVLGTSKLVLEATDKIQVLASATGDIEFFASYLEITD